MGEIRWCWGEWISGEERGLFNLNFFKKGLKKFNNPVDMMSHVPWN